MTASNKFKGRVSRLYVKRSGCSIRLDSIDTDTAKTQGPPNGYFTLLKEHENFNALYSLALAAAANRWQLSIRTVKDVNPTDPAIVLYFVVDWAAGQDEDDFD